MFERHRPAVETSTLQDIATGLGWFSIGLGVAELVAPRSITRVLGMEDEAEIVRAYGLREIAAGVGLLTQKDPTPWLWGRVAGDVLDIATLAIGLDKRNPRRGTVGLTMAAVVGITLVDIAVAKTLGDRRHGGGWWSGTVARLGIADAAQRLRGAAEAVYDRAYDRGRHLAGDARHSAEDVYDRGRQLIARARHDAEDAYDHGRRDLAKAYARGRRDAEAVYERSRRGALSGWRRAREEAEDFEERAGYPVRGRAWLNW